MPSMSTAIASCLRRAPAFAALATMLIPSSLPAQARATTEQTQGRRLALVLGSNAYTVAPLVNPTRDAVGVESQLRALDFDEVVLVLDADLATMRTSIDNFAHRIEPSDVAVVYFAGHGFQIGGENYLVPVDFRMTNEENDAKNAALPASVLLASLTRSRAELVILILDACRDNPFTRALPGKPGTTRSLGDAPGLARMEPTTIQPATALSPATAVFNSSVLIQFPTTPGLTIDDDSLEGHSRFAAHLIEALGHPELNVEQMFNRVRYAVHEASKKQQLPSTIDNVGIELFLSKNPGPSETERLARLARETEDADWHKILSSDDPATFRTYLTSYPEGRYRSEATAMAEALARVKPPPEIPKQIIQATLNEYAAAYAKFDVQALKRVFPSPPSQIVDDIRASQSMCGGYRVVFGPDPKFYSGETASMVIAVVQSEYTCQRPKKNQKVPPKQMTDVFRLRLTGTRWVIEGLN
jgi:hypothetical protein